MSSFVYVFGGKNGDKKLRLSNVGTKIDRVVEEWAELKKTTGDCHGIAFIKELVGNNYDLSEVFKISYPMVAAIQKLFFVWKDILERAAAMIVNKNNMELPQFKSDSSSPILYYFMMDRGEYSEYRKLFSHISFDYEGYCQLEPEKRLAALLEFPVEALFSRIAELDLPVVFADLHKKMSSKIRTPARPEGSIDISNIHHDDCEELMDLLKRSKSYVIELENYYQTWARSIDEVSYLVQHNILDTFL